MRIIYEPLRHRHESPPACHDLRPSLKLTPILTITARRVFACWR